ncbi:MAG: GIY-YIG nuclease family protein [Acidobacteria bacterium]|nr:GIY-YIG nuclease family protein [Acidobacteriota bacterium]
MPYYVYILTNRSRNLYTGVTNNISRRVGEHRESDVLGFTKRYRIHRLVYVEAHASIRTAIAREKQIKRWRREKKMALIEASNPAWDDLAAGWFASTEKRRADSSTPPRQARARSE